MTCVNVKGVAKTHIMWGSEGRGGTNQEVLDNSQSHVLNLMLLIPTPHPAPLFLFLNCYCVSCKWNW